MQIRFSRAQLLFRYRRLLIRNWKQVGGKHNFVARIYRSLTLILGFCAGTLILTASGCATGQPPLTLGDDVRATLGTVGIISTGPSPEGVVTGPIGAGREAGVGAVRGGAIGGASGAGTGALLGLATGPCAPLAVPLFAAIGAGGGLIIGGGTGAIYHAVTAVPEELANEITLYLSVALEERNLPVELREQLFDRARARAGNSVLVLDQGSQSAPPEEPDYSSYAEQGVNTVLEISIEGVSFAAEDGDDPELSLVIIAKPRLISVSDNQVLWGEEQVVFLSDAQPYSAWKAQSGMLDSEINSGLDSLAAEIVNVLYPGTTI